jgi:hypothetical protein
MPNPSKQHRVLVRTLFLGASMATAACQMVSGDEVPRTPPLVRGSGGSGGRDVATPDELVAELPDAPATEDASPCALEPSDCDAGLDTGTKGDACGRDGGCDSSP